MKFPDRSSTGEFRTRREDGYDLVRSTRTPVLFVLLLSFALPLVGCAPSAENGTNGNASRTSSSAESVLRSLVRDYETRNVASFMDSIHADYQAGTMNRDDLRYQVSRVHDQYGRMDVELYGQRVEERGPRRVIRTDWELNWICQAPGPGCTASGEEVRRRGRTTFVFRKSSAGDTEGWKLVADDDAQFFGQFQPGRIVR